MENKMNIDMGIDANKREAIAGGLSRVLADTYIIGVEELIWNAIDADAERVEVILKRRSCGRAGEAKAKLAQCRESSLLE